MSYTVLARRYRSSGFDEVVGQEAVARTLRNAIATDRVAHAYLFTGTRGVGKTTMARILAKALNCMEADGPTAEPCGRCASCEGIAEGEDLDVLEIDGASNTGVDHIRELRQNAIYRPARARFKIYIIDEVHMLSVSAFNALLKTLEEPPEHVKFILATTEPNKVLATIQSRCQRFDFRNLSVAEIAGQLDKVLEGEKVAAQEGVTRRLARLARGSMRDALSLMDQLLSMAAGELTLELLAELTGTPDWQQTAALVQAMQEGDLAALLTTTGRAFDGGYSPEALADTLQEYLRDLMVLASCGAGTELVEAQGEAREAMLKQAGGTDEAALVYQITVLEELRRALRSGASGRALLEAALVRLARTERFSDTKALLEQLGRLASQAPAPTRPAAAPMGQASPAGESRAGNAQAANAASAAPAPSGPALQVPETLSVEFFQQQWAGIIEAMVNGPSNLGTYIGPARPEAFANGTLRIDFAGHGTGRFLSTQPGLIAEISQRLGAVVGQSVRLEINAGSDGGGSPAAQSAQQAPTQARAGYSPGSKPSQREINEALSDPTVKQVQTLLKGKVKGVERCDPHG